MRRGPVTTLHLRGLGPGRFGELSFVGPPLVVPHLFMMGAKKRVLRSSEHLRVALTAHLYKGGLAAHRLGYTPPAGLVGKNFIPDNNLGDVEETSLGEDVRTRWKAGKSSGHKVNSSALSLNIAPVHVRYVAPLGDVGPMLVEDTSGVGVVLDLESALQTSPVKAEIQTAHAGE